MDTSSVNKRKKTLSFLLSLVIIVSLGLTLIAMPREPSTNDSSSDYSLKSLAWLSQLTISLIATIASLSEITGLNLRDLLEYIKPVESKNFPFEIIRNTTDLENLLYPSVVSNIADDKHIPFTSRLSATLDKELQRHGKVLVIGKSKTGKTREVLEALKKWWETHPSTTVLVAKDFAQFSPPFEIPSNMPSRDLVLFFDDLDRYCMKEEYIAKIIETISFFLQICRDPNELHVVATAREEPEFFNTLKLEKHYWVDFKKIHLASLSPKECRKLVGVFADHFQITIDDEAAGILASKNDGTILNIILSFRYWVSNGIFHVTVKDTEYFHGNLGHTWDSRYRSLVNNYPFTRQIYAAIVFLQDIHIPLQRELVLWVSTEYSLPKLYHFITGYLAQIETLFVLSPKANWIKDSKLRHKAIFIFLVLAVLIFYVSTYFLFRFYSFRKIDEYLQAVRYDGWLIFPVAFFALFIPFTYLLLEVVGVILTVYRDLFERKVKQTISVLTRSEIRTANDVLLPYENQCDSTTKSEILLSETDRKSLIQKPHNIKLGLYFLNWAEKYRLTGNFDIAQNLAIHASLLLPQLPESHYVLGNIAFDKGDYRDAKQKYLKSAALDTSKTKALAYERCAWSCYKTGKYADAINFAVKSLNYIPKLSSALWVLGITLIKQGSSERGIETIKTAIRLSPSEVPQEVDTVIREGLNTNQKWALELSGETQNVKSRSIRTAGNLKFFNLFFAIFLIVLSLWGAISVPKLVSRYRDSGELVILSNVILTIYPNTPLWLGARAHGYDLKGDYILAIEDNTKAIELLPDPGLYNNRGLVYIELGKYSFAIDDFSECIILDPRDWRCYYNRGIAYYAIGEYDKAELDFSMAQSLGK